jgi:putative ABC transport system substrate-binding protein
MHDRFSRRAFLRSLALAGCAAPLLACRHQPRQRVPRLGFVLGRGFPDLHAAFEGTLRDLGYIPGHNLIVETGESPGGSADLPSLVAAVAARDVDLVVAASLPVALEVRKQMPDMPMVIATCPGMISNGFAETLERPGRNATGLDELPPGVTARRLELLCTAAPRVTRVALLSTTPGRGGHETQLADAEAAAGRLGVTVKPYRARSLAELEAALPALVRDGMNGLLNFQGALSLVNRSLIVEFAAQHSLPAIYQTRRFIEAGGLMTWGPDLEEQFRAAARYADRILKGANAGDLPVQYPTGYALTINRRTAQALGLELPPELLREAEQIVG